MGYRTGDRERGQGAEGSVGVWGHPRLAARQRKTASGSDCAVRAQATSWQGQRAECLPLSLALPFSPSLLMAQELAPVELQEQTNADSFVAPHPGSPAMPRWTTGELVDVPSLGWRNIFAL